MTCRSRTIDHHQRQSERVIRRLRCVCWGGDSRLACCLDRQGGRAKDLQGWAGLYLSLSSLHEYCNRGGVGVVVGRPGLAWAAPTYSSNTLYRGSVYVVYICFQNARSNQVVRSTCVCRYRFPNGSSQIVAVILDERSSPFVSKA